MSWFDFFKGRKPADNAKRLRESLFDAVESGDSEAFDRICRDSKRCIMDEFGRWQKVPEVLRPDSKAVARYGRGLIAVADWFAQNGAPQLRTALQGEGRANPILG